MQRTELANLSDAVHMHTSLSSGTFDLARGHFSARASTRVAPLS